MPGQHTEYAFETVIEAHLLANGYVRIAPNGFDRVRAIFPATVLAFIPETQPKEWARLAALHGEHTGEQVLGDRCKWMDQNCPRIARRWGNLVGRLQLFGGGINHWADAGPFPRPPFYKPLPNVMI